MDTQDEGFVNYYERHLGDYARDTGHLCLLEHGAYSLLLDRYYATEKPIPKALVYRIARAQTPDEIAAVDAVLNEFFVPRDTDGTVAYHNRRADEAIAAYHDSQVDVVLKRENEADRKRRYRARRTELFAKLRDVGVIPDFNTPIDELERMLSDACPMGQIRGQDADVAINGTANQTPDTNPQSQENQNQSSTAAPLTAGPNEAGAKGGADKATARMARLAQVTRDAIETFNESKLTKANGGLVPNVDPDVGADKRRAQVAKCIAVARDICKKNYETELITREFWADYWTVCHEDEHKSGRVGGGKDHAKWVPTFEYLTREATMLETYDRARAAAEAGGAQ